MGVKEAGRAAGRLVRGYRGEGSVEAGTRISRGKLERRDELGTWVWNYC